MRRVRLHLAGLFAAITVGAMLLALPGSAAAACVYPSSYPGDDGAKASIAAWMAGKAIEAGIPGELPVMGGLASTDLRNTRIADADEIGYFLMRQSIWDQGDYAGYYEHPSLQVQWFIDQALSIRQKRIAAGQPQYGQDSSGWGEWVADVERPASQYRYRYQLRLDEARGLIASGCSAPDGGGAQPGPDHSGGAPADPANPGSDGSEPDAQLIPESVLPALQIKAGKRQAALRSGGLVVTALCRNENCLARAAGTVAIPGRGLFRMSVAPRQLKKGQRTTFRLVFGKKLRRLVASALKRRSLPRAAIRVIAANAGGYRISASRTVTVTRR